jgi:hypothetical protein
VTPGVRWRLAEGALLAAVAVGCLAFQLWLPTTHVAEADYAAVAQVLEREAQPGDALLLAPWWTERARHFVPARVPVVGYQGSDADDLEASPRVWVLAEPDLPRAGLDRFQAAFGPGRTEVGQERRFGPLSLRLFANGRHRPIAFSSEDLPSAQVYLEQPDGARVPCPWDGRAARCPTNQTVALEWHEVRFRPLHCLRLDAPGGPARLVVEFPRGPAASGVKVLAGYPGELATRTDATDSTVGLEVDGVVTPLPVPRGVERLHQVERGPIPAGATVRVWVQSDNPFLRQLCVVVEGFAAR